MKQRPIVGLGVFVRKEGKILLGHRINSHAPNVWAAPGGHLEYAETLEECARRETREEAGIEIENIQFTTVISQVYEEEGKHYIGMIMVADYLSGEVQVCEPDKCTEWAWFAWDDLPEPIYPSYRQLLEQAYNPFDYEL